MVKLYLHLGFSKTATTAIQVFLHNNKSRLKEHGILFPNAFNWKSSHHKLFWLSEPIRQVPSPSGNTIIKNESFESHLIKLKEEVLESSCNSIVLSSEMFSNNNYFDKLLFIKNSFNFLEIHPIIYLRRQDQLISSFHNQLVKNNHYRGSLQKFIKVKSDQFGGLFDNLKYSYFLKKLGAVFDNEKIVARVFSSSCFRGGSIFRDFLFCMGLIKDDDFVFPSKRTNISLKEPLLEIKRRLNQIPIDRIGKEEIKRSLLGVPQDRLEQFYVMEDRTTHINDISKKLVELYNNDNMQLVGHWLDENEVEHLLIPEKSTDKVAVAKSDISQVINAIPPNLSKKILISILNNMSK